MFRKRYLIFDCTPSFFGLITIWQVTQYFLIPIWLHTQKDMPFRVHHHTTITKYQPTCHMVIKPGNQEMLNDVSFCLGNADSP